MGTSFFDHDERFVERSSLQQQRRKPKKRPSTKKERHDIVRNSLEQFLVDAQLEDFVVFDEKQQQPTQDRHRSNFKTQAKEDMDSTTGIDSATTDADSSVDLFDRNALAAAGKSSRRQSRKKKKRGTRPRKSQKQQQPQSEDEQSFSSSKIFETSLNKPFDGHQSEGSLSLSDLKKMDEGFSSDTPKRRRSSRRSQEKRRRPSTGSYSSLNAGVRPRSQIGTGNNSDSALNNRKNNDLVRGLNTLDRQVRRDRMKKEYRTPSVDIRSVGGSTGASTRGSISTTSTGSRSLSYKRTGFEGGALNAIMGNQSFAKIASNGGDIASLSESATFNTSRSDLEFLMERKARQDKIKEEILDMIARENSLRDKTQDKEQQSENQSIDLESTSLSQEQGKKKKDIVKKMKKAARKTAKMSKSGARIAANALVDASKQRSARKGYKPAPEFIETEEEQPLEMAKTPTHSNKKKARSSTKTSKRSSKSKKGKGTKSTSSFESFESSPFTSPVSKKAKQGKESSAKSFNSFTSFDTLSPFRSRHGRTTAKATTKVKPKITRNLNDSMSGNFPDFQLADTSTVVWWDL